MVSVYANVNILQHLCCTVWSQKHTLVKWAKSFWPQVGRKDWDSPENPEAGMF